MMRLFYRLTGWVLGLSLLASCASVGNDFDLKAVSQFKPGVTTISDAVSLFKKEPSQVLVIPMGTVNYWRYVSSNGLTGETKIKEIGIIFDNEGKYVRVIQVQKSA